MKISKTGLTALTCATLLLAGCGQSPASSAGAVALVDLSAVARATGEDQMIRQRSEAGQQEMMVQLQQLAQMLEANLAAEEDKAGSEPTAADTERLQQMTQDARQQVAQAQQQAQQEVQQLQTDLVMEFRNALLPIAQDIAADRGASVILLRDANVLWAAEGVDITAEVIAAWQAQPGAAAPSAEPAASESAVSAAPAPAAMESTGTDAAPSE